MAISKTSKSEKIPSHPKYNEMIASAIRALKERSGSSRQAILKYVVAFYRIEDERRAGVHVKLALKRGVADGSLRQMKGSGASGSFRLAKEDTKSKAKSLSDEKRPKLKKVATKKPAVKKLASKKPSSKQTATKKPARKQTTAKKPGVKKTADKTSICKKTAAMKPVSKKTKETKSDGKKATKTPGKKTLSKKSTGNKTAKAPVAKKLTKNKAKSPKNKK